MSGGREGWWTCKAFGARILFVCLFVQLSCVLAGVSAQFICSLSHCSQLFVMCNFLFILAPLR